MYFKQILSLLALAVPAVAGTGLEVNIEGTNNCIDEERVQSHDFVTVHYTGFIADSSSTGEIGAQFDSSRGGKPFGFHIGQGRVIKGWDEGIIGLCLRNTATLIVPPEYGYGESGRGTIPGAATLRFEVEIVDIEDGASKRFFEHLDKDGSDHLDKDEIMGHFERNGRDLPHTYWRDVDTDRDGKITWTEFNELNKATGSMR